jgi:hypothetical protein
MQSKVNKDGSVTTSIDDELEAKVVAPAEKPTAKTGSQAESK